LPPSPHPSQKTFGLMGIAFAMLHSLIFHHYIIPKQPIPHKPQRGLGNAHVPQCKSPTGGMYVRWGEEKAECP